MECTPAGQSTPAVHGFKKLYKENKSQIVPQSLQPRQLTMPLSLPGESDQTLTQWTVCTKGIGIFSTNCLIPQNPQLHCTPTLTPSLLWLYWHIVLVLHQYSDVCKYSLLAKLQTWGLLQACFPSMGGCHCCDFLSHSDWPPTDHSDLNVSEQSHPRRHPSKQGSAYNRYGLRKEKG